MSFFKEFKDDLSQAVNELITDDSSLEDDEMVNTLDQEETEAVKQESTDEKIADADNNSEEDAKAEYEYLLQRESSVEEGIPEETIPNQDAFIMNESTIKEPEELTTGEELPDMDTEQMEEGYVDESAVITKGMTITGNVESKGSIEVVGVINGDIASKGKIVVTGEINGNSKANEFFADSAKITGEISCEGSVKIGQGSVVVGNVSGASVVIAGAVNGDIDVKGPVIVDSSAVVVGNIKSRSVQINNGAVIEGFCSQSYAEVNVKSIFGEDAKSSKDKK